MKVKFPYPGRWHKVEYLECVAPRGLLGPMANVALTSCGRFVIIHNLDNYVNNSEVGLENEKWCVICLKRIKT